MDAELFFHELDRFTEAWAAKYLPGVNHQSPWSSQGWKDGCPGGAIIHFTADVDLKRVMRWFLEKRFNSRVSAHAVVAPAWTDELRELAKGLPLVEALPAPVLQPVDPWREAWHATWTNGWAYGIENLNMGELQCRAGEFFSWRPRDRSAHDWTTLWDVADGEPIPLLGRWWAPYTEAQLATNVELLQVLRSFHGHELVRSRVLGHECVQFNKRDPGPAFPVHAIREALFDDSWSGIEVVESDFMNGQNWRDARCMSAFGEDSPTKAAEYFSREAQLFLGEGKKWSEMDLALQLLGYCTRPEEGDIPIRIFQQMMSLTVDGVVGGVTRRALLQRLEDCGLVS